MPPVSKQGFLMCYTYTKTRDVCSKEQLQHAIDLDFACAHDATSPPRWRLELKLGALALPRLVDTKRPDARIYEAHLKGGKRAFERGVEKPVHPPKRKCNVPPPL